VCLACGSAALELFPVLHHMPCAYVGPEYDFPAVPGGYLCPKCRRGIVANDPACEIVAQSARCASCGREMPVSPEPAGSGADAA
jgi:hypothetical protein